MVRLLNITYVALCTLWAVVGVALWIVWCLLDYTNDYYGVAVVCLFGVGFAANILALVPRMRGMMLAEELWAPIITGTFLVFICVGQLVCLVYISCHQLEGGCRDDVMLGRFAYMWSWIAMAWLTFHTMVVDSQLALLTWTIITANCSFSFYYMPTRVFQVLAMFSSASEIACVLCCMWTHYYPKEKETVVPV